MMPKDFDRVRDSRLGGRLKGRSIVGCEVDFTRWSDGSESFRRVLLELDDGVTVQFDGIWCNDSTADLGVEFSE